jgi:hypothetical protein
MGVTVPTFLQHYPLESKRQLLTVVKVVVKTMFRSPRPLPDAAPTVKVGGVCLCLDGRDLATFPLLSAPQRACLKTSSRGMAAPSANFGY